VNGYTPRDPVTLALVGCLLVATLLVGLALNWLPPRRYARWLAWLVTVGMTAGVERLCRDEPAGLRMLAIIGALLFGMKAAVTVEARRDGMPALSVWRWLGFAALWPGMRPAIFAPAGRGPQRGAWVLIGKGCGCASLGLVLALLTGMIWRDRRPDDPEAVVRFLATVLLLPAVSLIVHFGIFDVLAGAWRLAGVDARPLFRAPLASRSLSEFWSRRWNLAFSEMMSLAISRPLSGLVGRKAATAIAFVASGLLHELAISVPVRAGFGLPLCYFLLHGTLVLAEGVLDRAGRAVTGWEGWAHVWVLTWLALPLPILFHRPFLRGVVWPLIGMD
jgi:alginate O-acetyltransferase complex protein AlgI